MKTITDGISMKCPKCGSELSDVDTRCGKCGIKVRMKCPECGTLNKFGSHNCINCNFELIKVCPSCGSSNMYYAGKCRKCGHEFEEKKQEEEIKTYTEPDKTDKTEPAQTKEELTLTDNEFADEILNEIPEEAVEEETKD